MALTRLTSANAIPDDSVANVKMANIVQSKNAIINGDMQICQRGTSFTSNGYTLDRYTMDESTDGAVTVTQDTDVPSGYGFAKSLKVDCTTADASIGAAQYCGFTQLIEGQNLQYLKYGTSSAQTLTLSFWVKSVKTGTYCVRFVKEAGSGTRYECPIEYTISSASTWEKKTITLTPSAGSTSLITAANGAIVNSNASGFRVFFALAVGSNFHATNNTWVAGSDKLGTSNQVNFLDSTSNDFWITGIQLEAGDTASEFEFLPYDLNWLRCFRYCLAIGNAPGGTTYNYADNSIIGYYYNGTDFYPNYFYPVPMRATPGVTFSGTGSGLGVVYSDSAGDTTTSNGTNVTSNTNLNFRCSTSQSNQTYGGAFDFSADQYALLSAEL